MSVANPWTQHRQSFWQFHAGNTSLPLWLRIAALAYGVHRRNGHAPFGPGDLRLALSFVDTATGEIMQPSTQRLSNEIDVAVRYGFLSHVSCASCLVVPASISGGMTGKTNEACRQRHSRRGVTA